MCCLFTCAWAVRGCTKHVYNYSLDYTDLYCIHIDAYRRRHTVEYGMCLDRLFTCVGCKLKGLYKACIIMYMHVYTKIILLYMYTAKQFSHSPVTIDTTRPASRATGSFFNAASNSPAERGLAKLASYTYPCVRFWSECFRCGSL